MDESGDEVIWNGVSKNITNKTLDSAPQSLEPPQTWNDICPSKIKWKHKFFETIMGGDVLEDRMCEFLGKLQPWQSLMAKIVYGYGDGELSTSTIIYPVAK